MSSSMLVIARRAALRLGWNPDSAHFYGVLRYSGRRALDAFRALG